MSKPGVLAAIVCTAVVSACGGSDKPESDEAAGESALSPLTDTLDEAAKVEDIIDQQKRRTDALLDEAEDGDSRPQG